MRSIRWLLPLAIVLIVVAVGALYFDRMAEIARNAPARPDPLSSALEGRASDWCHTEFDGDLPRVRICAAENEQLKDPPRVDLRGVVIQLYHDNASEFDLVESDAAQFDMEGKKFYSDGAVEITLGVPADVPPQEAPAGRLLKIRTSGVEFSSETGRATTTRAVAFEFDQGGGSAVGANYDPDTRELRLLSEVKLDWRGRPDDESEPMHIESGEAWYIEREGKVLLYPWSRLERGALRMEGGTSEIFLEEGVIRRAEVEAGRGSQADARRNVEFGAGHLSLQFDDSMQMEQVHGESSARLASKSRGSRTTVTSDRLDLEFEPDESETQLRSARATGGSRVEAVPAAVSAGAEVPDTRVLKSDVIRLAMRDGGQEIDRVETDGPGTLEFLPNRPGQPVRSLEGGRIWIDYGAENRIRRFRATNANTRTERQNRPPMLTHSQELIAYFDAATGILSRLEQNTDFRYEEGEQRAVSERATVDQANNLITLMGEVRYTEADQEARADKALVDQNRNTVTLDGRARTTDASGAVSADHIAIDRKTGDYTADGHVTATRLPQSEGAAPGTLFSDREVLQAVSRRMVTTEGNQRIRFEGEAKAWQGADRVEAEVISIDRAAGTMEATGGVVTQFTDGETPEAKSTVFTVVHAPALFYSENERLAHYRGGVQLERPGLSVDSLELRAYLNPPEAESSLDRAFADGKVKIVSTPEGSNGTRTGTSERAEYYTAEQRVVLSGGRPRLVDSVNGKRTEGQKLTWFVNDDRLLFDGEEEKPVQSTFRKR